MNHWFSRVASWVGWACGHPLAFIASAAVIIVWLISGPLFGFSDTWQLVVNTGTTVVTYLLLFIVQNTQNRDSAALHVKLDEILRALPQARTEVALAHLEDADESSIRRQRREVDDLAQAARGEEAAKGG